MQLNDAGLKDAKVWEEAGFSLPSYDREMVKKETEDNPEWLHFGAGNICRAFPARGAQSLLEKGYSKTGIVVAEGFDEEIVEKMYRPHDGLSILVTLKADGTVEKSVIGSVTEYYALNAEKKEEFSRLKEIFRKTSLKLATFTITEKGYSLADAKGELFPQVREDFQNGPVNPVSYMGRVAALLYTRFKNGKKPVAMVSMDNCSHNGDKLKAAMISFAKKWAESGAVESDYPDYVQDPSKVSFPWTMIDKITPRPDDAVKKILKEDGVEGLETVITSKNTYVAPFVNAEESEYLVIEDIFPNGRPPLEKAGFLFTDRETVDKVEKMKVCTCLNPLHTALAVYGCLLGYQKISEEMKDPQLKKLVQRIGYQEGLPVVVNPGILNPKEFIDTVVKIRLPNPFMPDTPQRIATDTSQKLSIRYGETIKAYAASDALQKESLVGIPLVLAGWLRYLMAVDDLGNSFSLSPDPLLDSVIPFMASFHLGEEKDQKDIYDTLNDLLSNTAIFGVDLCQTGLAYPVCNYLKELIVGKGAVRSTLKKYMD